MLHLSTRGLGILLLGTIILPSHLASQESPRVVRRPADPAEPQSRSSCDGRELSGNALPRTFSKATFSTCAQAEAAAEFDVTSMDYRLSCQSQFGGLLPPSVGVEASCSDGGKQWVVDISLCCPNPCESLDMLSCRALDRCRWGRCKHANGSLTCSDLTGPEQCDRYASRCNWETAQCVTGGVVPFECNDLSSADCGGHAECGLESECRHQSGSLTCADLNKGQCSSYDTWCNWISGACRKRLVAGPFECRNLSAADCKVESECSLTTKCRHQAGSLTCNDLSLAECGTYSKWCNSKAARCIKDPAAMFKPFTCGDLQELDCVGESECKWEALCLHHSE